VIRVDSHFHPNINFLLPERLKQKHVSRFWREFDRNNLDAVFISEHSYKHPARSYQYMKRYRPKGAKTMLVPAVEALTKEGMDVIVFSRDEHVYSRKDILTPYGLTMDLLLKRVCEDHRLFAIIPHPFIPCSTGLMHHRKREETKDCIRRAHFVEKYNASLRPLQHLICVWKLQRFFRRKIHQLMNTANVPSAMIDKGVIVFGGSDAHRWWDIGTHLLIHTNCPVSPKALFNVLIKDDKSLRTIVWRRKKLSLVRDLLSNGIAVFLEGARKFLSIWQVDTSFPPYNRRCCR
jgi:hypothetical protein